MIFPLRFLDKVCIITGGSSGIGKATAKRLSLEGAKVAILNRSENEGNAAAEEIQSEGGNAIFIKTDIIEPDDINAAFKKVLDKWQKVDVVINNAAMMTFKPITEVSVDEWDELMAVNIRAVFLLSQCCLRYMEKGAIVNVSSVHAHETTPNVVPYATSKGAMEAFTRGLSREYDSRKIRINNVAPGAVDTPMLWENPNIKSGKEKIEGTIGTPDDIAAAICFLASDEAGFINGTTLVVDGGRLNIL